MTLFAGVYSFKPEGKIDHKITKLLESLLSQTAGKVDAFSDRNFVFVKYDCEAFKVPGFAGNEKYMAAITGEPYINTVNGVNYSRYSDLLTISEQLVHGNLDVLRSCHGTYSVCCYDKIENSLILATDKLGERPIYYFIDDHYLFFSSKLGILEKVDAVPKRLNVSALIEERVFGVPLGDKTYYCDIKLLRDGQYLQCGKDLKRVSYYFRWDRIAPCERSSEELLQQSFDAFKAAVSCRIKEENEVIACLSGGLDSRSVVSILNSMGKNITAFNFSRTGEQDEAFAAKYADHLGINYFATKRPHEGWTWGALISEALTKIKSDLEDKVKHPRVVFTGDGGSVGVGHVYMNDKLVNLLKQEKTDEALRYFLEKRNFPRRVFKKEMISLIEKIPIESLNQEFNDLEGVDPGRKFYLFLLRNDQRRHLHKFFEDIDLNRVELLLPFYDTRLLEIIVSAPVEEFIGHKFYHNWLQLFPEGFKSVPWQTYPGHQPCPVPHDPRIQTQWVKNANERFKAGGALMHKCFTIILAKNFPGDILRRSILSTAILMHRLKIEDYDYLFNFVVNFHQYYSKSSGYRFNCNEK